MQLQLRSECWDLNAFHRDLVGRVVRACHCDRLLHVGHRFSWSLQMIPLLLFLEHQNFHDSLRLTWRNASRDATLSFDTTTTFLNLFEKDLLLSFFSSHSRLYHPLSSLPAISLVPLPLLTP